MIAMLRDLRSEYDKPVWIELGLQTIHEKTAGRINRGYKLEVFEDAYRRLKDEGFEVIVHVILGLPGESREDMLETVRYLSLLTPALDGIKLQLLHILKGTELAREYEADPFPLFTLDSYCDLVVDCLETSASADSGPPAHRRRTQAPAHRAAVERGQEACA